MSDEQSPFLFKARLDQYLATLSKIYEREKRRDLRAIIVNSKVRVQEGIKEADYNDDVFGHAIQFAIPEQLFTFGLKETRELQDKIRSDLNSLLQIRGEFIDSVSLEVAVGDGADWRVNSGLTIRRKQAVPDESAKRIWGDKESFKLFLSHISAHKVEAAKLKDRLHLFGVSCFVAHEDIEPLKEWQNEIELALASMDGLAALLTPGFHESKWTDQEIGFALAKGVPIIPVRLGTDPYGFMGKSQALSTDWKEAPLGIAKLLIRHDRMLEAFIRALRHVSSYDIGNYVGGLLEWIERLTVAQADRIIAAYNANDQLRGSYVFNGRNSYYGPGLVDHLNRLGIRKFHYDNDHLIQHT